MALLLYNLRIVAKAMVVNALGAWLWMVYIRFVIPVDAGLNIGCRLCRVFSVGEACCGFVEVEAGFAGGVAFGLGTVGGCSHDIPIIE